MYRRSPLPLLLLLVVLAPAAARAQSLETELGRNEVRVFSAPYELTPGMTVTGARVPERLERLGYRRVHGRPEAPGEYFWGHDVFWILRRAHRLAAREHPAELFGLALEEGRIVGFLGPDREPRWQDGRLRPWLEPEVLAESLGADRAPRLPVELDGLPERVWRPVLAAEDHRFFDHSGLDAIAIARAALANLRAGGVAQGGSTLTQQLVKMRDLSPRRTLGRKVSAAVRALALEAEYDKREILESYLNTVYFGNGAYGVQEAANTYFGKPARKLNVAQAATIAGVIRAPEDYDPYDRPKAALARRDTVLGKLAELGWVKQERIDRALKQKLKLQKVDKEDRYPAPYFMDYVQRLITYDPRFEALGQNIRQRQKELFQGG
ncbi:MAG TPA: transglycosylase domain-containing protein, partial [Thermoanaerobaculia bacterium]